MGFRLRKRCFNNNLTPGNSTTLSDLLLHSFFTGAMFDAENLLIIEKNALKLIKSNQRLCDERNSEPQFSFTWSNKMQHFLVHGFVLVLVSKFSTINGEINGMFRNENKFFFEQMINFNEQYNC